MNRNRLIVEFTECFSIETEFTYLGEIDTFFALSMLDNHKKASMVELLAEAEKTADGKRYAIVFGEWETKVTSQFPMQTRFRRSALVYVVPEEGAAVI